LEFDVAAFEDLAWWMEKDRTQALRIIRLIREIPSWNRSRVLANLNR